MAQLNLNQSLPRAKGPTQFARLEFASPVAPKTRGSYTKIWSVSKILDEVDRVPGNCNHVADPTAPEWLLGNRDYVEFSANEWHRQAREAGGKARLRKTSPSLACAIVSCPDNFAGWVPYRDDVIKHFKQTHGDRVVGVVEHLDESHKHIHIYIVPRPREDFGAVHPGYKASREARKSPGNHVRTAFKKAMSLWQDALHAAAGVIHGLARLGPQRMRLLRAEYNAYAKGLEIINAAEADAKKQGKDADDVTTAAKKKSDEAELARVSAANLLADAIEADGAIVVRARALQSHMDRFKATPVGVVLKELEAANADRERMKDEIWALKFRLTQHEKNTATPELRSDAPLASPYGYGKSIRQRK